MKKGNTVYEDREEEKEMHTVQCPHCGCPVPDHLTVCPHCKGALKPRGYQPLSDEKIKKIRYITYTIGALAFIGVLLYLIFR